MISETYCRQTGKLSNGSRFEAKEQLASLRRKHRHYRGSAYFCRFCRGWHVGREGRLKGPRELSR